MRVAHWTGPALPRALIAVAALCAAASALVPGAAEAAKFKGQWSCNDRGAKRPISGARVQLYERNWTGMPASVVAVEQDRDYTDGEGRFTMTEPGNDSDKFFVRLTLKDRDDVHLRNWYSPFNYTHDSGLLRNNASTKDFGVIQVGSSNPDRSPKCAAWRAIHLAHREYQDATGGEPPYDELLIRGDAVSAGVPYTTHPTINWPANYPPDVDPGGITTGRHEFAHSFRHVFDGSAAHFFHDVSRFGYTRQHEVCLKTNAAFAFNEGWAEYWAGDYAPAPNCPDVSSTDYDVEGNVAAALARLDADCFGVSRRDMVRVLARHPGAIHSFAEFRDRLPCDARPGPVVVGARPPDERETSAADARAAARAHIAFFRREVRDRGADLREARRAAQTPPACRRRPCLAALAARIEPAILEGLVAHGELLVRELAFTDDPAELGRLSEPMSSAFERRIEAVVARIERRTAQIGARMIERALEAGEPVFRADGGREMREIAGALRAQLGPLRAVARGRPFPETFALPSP